VLWRDAEICAAPIAGATAESIVCADANGTRAIGLDGKPRWSTRAPFITFTDERVAVSEGGASVILDADNGDELARIRLPRGVSPDSVLATCGDAGRELFAIAADGKLVRVAEALGGPALSWAVPMSAVLAIDACGRDSVVATEAGPGGLSLVAIARATGKVSGRIDGTVAWWPARDGSERIEVVTARGVARIGRDLVGTGEPLDLPALGELLASRGDRRLVRATPLTAVLLDRDGVRAYLPFAAMGAVLGDGALITTRWVGSPGETAHRFGVPPRWNRSLRVPSQRSGIALDAELRDLPPVLPLDAGRAVAQVDTGMQAVTSLAIDPVDPTLLYAVAIDERGDVAIVIDGVNDAAGSATGRGSSGAVVCADLAARRWRWQRVDGCGPGVPVALAVARDNIVCGTHRPLGTRRAPAMIRATSRDGVARWDWVTDHLDALSAAGDIVVAHDADRITVLDARDGRVRGHLASGDGGAMRVAIVPIDDATLVITAERGRIVARLPLAGLVPVWSITVAGTVRALARSGDGVLVALDDGDAYRIDARTAEVTALPGLGLGWHAAGDLVTGHTVGGPIPGLPPPPPPLTAAQLLRRPLQILRAEVPVPPPMSTPIPPPPPLGEAWQLTLYELTGGLRARNDYALPAPVAPPAVRGPPGSPLVIAYGPALREIVVLDPRTGDPLRRARLPDDAPPGLVFGTIVDGSPIAGTLLASPLRVVLF
jgi:PQQ-like domain